MNVLNNRQVKITHESVENRILINFHIGTRAFVLPLEVAKIPTAASNVFVHEVSSLTTLVPSAPIGTSARTRTSATAQSAKISRAPTSKLFHFIYKLIFH
jgi:hypothetical protein